MNEIEFGNYLRLLRKEQGLTIRQLEELSGVSNAYLSQLENGKRGIPSPEILKKLHRHLDVGFEELMLKVGHISDETKNKLTPESVELLNRYDELSELLSNALEIFIKSITNEYGEIKQSAKQMIIKEMKADHNYNEIDQVVEIFEDKAKNHQLLDELTISEQIEFLNMLIKGFKEDKIDVDEVFKNNEIEKQYSTPIISVPVLGHIAAGQPILAEEHIEEWTEIPNMWSLKQGEAIVLRVKGDSMIGSRIYDGDKVVVKLQSDVENGEIAVVNVNGDEATLKRVKKTENGQVILFPDNPKYDPTFITNENARIIGKVIQVMFEPR